MFQVATDRHLCHQEEHFGSRYNSQALRSLQRMHPASAASRPQRCCPTGPGLRFSRFNPPPTAMGCTRWRAWRRLHRASTKRARLHKRKHEYGAATKVKTEQAAKDLHVLLLEDYTGSDEVISVGGSRGASGGQRLVPDSAASLISAPVQSPSNARKISVSATTTSINRMNELSSSTSGRRHARIGPSIARARRDGHGLYQRQLPVHYKIFG